VRQSERNALRNGVGIDLLAVSPLGGPGPVIASCFWQADVKGVINDTTTLLGNGDQTTEQRETRRDRTEFIAFGRSRK
jgi:hypothetical protein